MRACIRYCVQEKKTVDADGRQYVGGVNGLGVHAYEEFMATKNLYRKASGVYFYQYVQSFRPGEIRSYEEAHRIGLEFAGQAFPGYEVLVATHLDACDENGAQRVHNHFIVNSVSFEDGRKIHFTPNTRQPLPRPRAVGSASIRTEQRKRHRYAGVPRHDEGGRLEISTHQRH